jgi:hypothetical protein
MDENLVIGLMDESGAQGVQQTRVQVTAIFAGVVRTLVAPTEAWVGEQTQARGCPRGAAVYGCSEWPKRALRAVPEALRAAAWNPAWKTSLDLFPLPDGGALAVARSTEGGAAFMELPRSLVAADPTRCFCAACRKTRVRA